MGAAAHWARESKRVSAGSKADPSTLRKDTRKWNLDDAAADAAWAWAEERREISGDAFEPLQPDGSYPVWPENWDSMQIFWRVRRCWRIVPFVGAVGFDWLQVEAKLRHAGIRRQRDLQREIERLERMEDAVLEVLNHE